MNGLFLRMRTITLFLALQILLPASGAFSAEPRAAKAQTVYVPVYSHVYAGNRALPVNLATTLSIRNTDRRFPITVTGADYYNSEGRLLRRMLKKPVTLRPMASTSIFIEEKDTSGGFGASFLVSWHATGQVNTPIIECLMIGAYSGLGISFVSPGQQIR